MIKRIIGLIVLVGIIAIGLWGWRNYQEYQARREGRVQRTRQQVEDVQITTIEGWTLAEIGLYVGKQNLVTEKEFNEALKNFDLSGYPLIATSKPAKANLEGYLFPDTYRFTKDTTPQAVIKKMLDNFTTRVGTAGVKSGQGEYTVPGYEKNKLSFYQLLTLASIVERETGSKGDGQGITPEQERALIAGVFYNRLGRGQALESDATINYVTGKNTPGVSATDLKLNSPYNTYRYPGLPPGPISNPSLASIKAVLNPAKTNFNFFFHRQPSGIAVFSKTFEEHRRKRAE